MSDDKKLDWNKLDALSDQQLAGLVESAVFVLKQSDAAPGPAVTDMPAGAMTRELEKQFRARGADAALAGRLVQDRALSRPVALALLAEIAREPALAQEVEHAWRERGGMLVIGVGVILATALLCLVLKLKKVKATRAGVEVDLDKLSTGALGTVLKAIA